MELSAIEIWAIAGVLLLVGELVATSFFLMFFGLGALASSLLTYLDVTPTLPGQIIAFCVVSLGSMLLFRKQFKEMFFRKGENYSEMLNERAKVSVDIPAKGEGKVFFRGADWIAENIHQASIAAGEQVIIRKIDGIRLLVEPE
ncbi:NfeD family protein [Jiulongibacter sp. NS-SX5]|uniref:NfeD family protein n=1 Tax=Jiulongibacter sp. NS-SX5 TaxID=3463854 RepID=UPI00405877BE